jgi:hypothetical protein
MNFQPLRALALATVTLTAVHVAPAPAEAQGRGWTRLFDGKTLSGWKLVGGSGRGYVVENGLLVCPADGGGKLLTENQYSDFVFRCQFKIRAGGNNGVAIRAPLEGDAAYTGMEVQILDDDAPKHAGLQPWQYGGSVYKVFAAKRGLAKPVGEWNQYEISAVGPKIQVKLNGKVVSQGSVLDVTDPQTLMEHPGLRRDRGHIGFLGHGEHVEFREIYVRDLSKQQRDNVPPQGFKAMFNGRDLTGWKGVPDAPLDNPAKRAAAAPAELAAAQAKANEKAQAHWKVMDGVLCYDGKGFSLSSDRDYGDFEMLVDWKLEPKGDSGIYLRGAPQVNIWDNPLGSGALYNNQKNPNGVLKAADKPAGEWNRFRILMVGEKVTVHLNDELVVNNVTLENYWERNKPIYPTGPIELQHHGDPICFKNVFIRELPRK